MTNLLEIRNPTTQFYSQDGTVRAVNGISHSTEKGETQGSVAMFRNNGNQNAAKEAIVKPGGLKNALPNTHGVFQRHVSDVKAADGISVEFY